MPCNRAGVNGSLQEGRGVKTWGRDGGHESHVDRQGTEKREEQAERECQKQRHRRAEKERGLVWVGGLSSPKSWGGACREGEPDGLMVGMTERLLDP